MSDQYDNGNLQDDLVQIAEVRQPAERMAKEVFYLPAVLLLGFIIVLQKRRARETEAPAAEATA